MYQKIFVPVDGSGLTERAIEASIGLARQLGASITGFVVEPDVPLPAPDARMSEYAQRTERHIEKTDTHAHKVLTDFQLKAAEAGVEFTGLHARTDVVDRAIVEQAEATGCDMIVMATHGRGFFGELLFGSHTRSVMAHSKLPLLVLH